MRRLSPRDLQMWYRHLPHKIPTPPPVGGRDRLALIVVHGMGDQWRTQMPSDLASLLDDFRSVRSRRTPRLNVVARTEVAKLPDGDSMTFLEVHDRTGANGFDLHEVYWAPLAGDGPAEADVLRWLRAQLMVPYQRQSAPWRRLPRLRRGMLQQLNAERTIGPGPQSALLGRYDDFGRETACRQYPEGTAEQFLTFLDERQPGLSADARLWIGHTRAFNAAAVWIVVSVVLLTLVFAVLAGETLGSVVQLVQPALFSGWQARYLLRPDSAADLYFTAPVSLLAVLVTLTWLLTLKSFLQQSLGDVLQ